MTRLTCGPTKPGGQPSRELIGDSAVGDDLAPIMVRRGSLAAILDPIEVCLARHHAGCPPAAGVSPLSPRGAATAAVAPRKTNETELRFGDYRMMNVNHGLGVILSQWRRRRGGRI